eukprot:329706_1
MCGGNTNKVENLHYQENIHGTKNTLYKGSLIIFKIFKRYWNNYFLNPYRQYTPVFNEMDSNVQKGVSKWTKACKRSNFVQGAYNRFNVSTYKKLNKKGRLTLNISELS